MTRFLNYLKNRNLEFQSYVFWFVGIMHITTDEFWYFVTPAILFTGLQSILDELRKSKNNG